jgi:hypothetical protein
MTEQGAGRVMVRAQPASEHILAFVDPKGLDYAQSPRAFGVELWHLDP